MTPNDGRGHRRRRARSRSSPTAVTTDHISPAGNIKEASPAGRYLNERQVSRSEFNSYGARRGNHEVMMRGTFANIRIKNEMVPGVEGGITRMLGENGGGRMAAEGGDNHGHGAPLDIFDAAEKYRAAGHAARHHRRQGIRHRLVARLGSEGHDPARRPRGDRRELRAHPPLEPRRDGRRSRSSSPTGVDRKTLGLTGDETFTVTGMADLKPRQTVTVAFTRGDGTTGSFETVNRIDTARELDYFYAGGILPYVLRKLAA